MRWAWLKFIDFMIQSMTGYGRAEVRLDKGKLIVEFRSVNGKNADISVKACLLPKDKEMPLRKRVASLLQRGTIDIFMSWEPDSGSAARKIDRPLALEYLKQMKLLASEAGAPDPSSSSCIVSALLHMPDVLDNGRVDKLIDDGNWPLVEKAIDEALEAIVCYRRHEGEALYADVTSRVRTILSLVDEIEGFEAERLSLVRERILKAAAEVGIRLDGERFEQEMVYYLEKYDINEEKVRLRQHCKYFMDTIDNEEYPGKKLGFIIQEMGREINTTGSKANHSGIQKAVVRMKDELEKIREQSLNIL